MEKLIITAAICGAEVTKKHNPAVPYTVEEMVREAKSAFEAGAAVIHVHVREDDGTPTQDRERFRVVLDAIKEACPGVILIPSTGGAVGMTAEERLQPTELFPEMATLDCGTCNFGDAPRRPRRWGRPGRSAPRRRSPPPQSRSAPAAGAGPAGRPPPPPEG